MLIKDVMNDITVNISYQQNW